jgi:D-glycero-alpha-D-manno-heptose-7-phosphate kinase
MIIESRAPTRVDLAGGTLDIWPLFLFHEDSQTVNFAVDLYATCRMEARRGRGMEFVSRDLKRRESFPDLGALLRAERYRLPLIARLVRYFMPHQGFSLTTDSKAPAGAGIAGSSALNIAICGALNRFTHRRLNLMQLQNIARNVEAQVIRVPTGEQDYFPAMYGGLNAVHLTPGGVRVERLRTDLAAFERRIALCYTGAPRDSGINNWEVTKLHIDGNKKVIRNFEQIAAIARAMRRALEKNQWSEVARLLRAEWEHRRKNAPGISTPLIDHLIAAARKNGALAAKVCGAGGGGCVLFFTEDGARDRVERTLAMEGGRPLPFRVATRGLTVRVVRA